MGSVQAVNWAAVPSIPGLGHDSGPEEETGWTSGDLGHWQGRKPEVALRCACSVSARGFWFPLSLYLPCFSSSPGLS